MPQDFNIAQWTAQDLLEDVYRACRLPQTGTVDYTPARVLTMATQSIHDWAGHMAQTAREGRLSTTFLRAMETDAVDVAGESYELPNMAAADTVEAVIWADPQSGNEKRLEIVPAAMLPLFTRTTDRGTPQGYAFFDGTVTIFPRPNAAGVLKYLYQRRHGVLSTPPEDYSAHITAAVADPAGTLLSVFAVPPFLSLATNPGLWVDVVQAALPYRFKVHGARVLSVVGSDVLISTPFDEAQKAGVVGQTLVPYGRTIYVHLPLEMRETVTRQISSRLLSEIGDMPISMAHDAMATASATRVRDMMSPRAKSQPNKLFNPHSLARGGSSWRRRWSGS
jgi:hypothetical protein